MIVATTETLLINAISPKGERIVVWKDKDGLFNAFESSSDSPTVSIIAHGSLTALFDSLEFTDWVLMGIQSIEIQNALKIYFLKVP